MSQVVQAPPYVVQQGPPPVYQPATNPQPAPVPYPQEPPPAYQPATDQHEQIVDSPQRTQLLVLVTQPRPNPVVRRRLVFEVGKKCPLCQVGTINENFSAMGILMCLLFFPIGVICCLAMTDKKCSHCGITAR